MKYKKKLEIIEAIQWFRDEDHPDVKSRMWSNRKDSTCDICGYSLRYAHGSIVAVGNRHRGHMFCPGDYIVTDPFSAETYRVSKKSFEEAYEQA